MQAAEQALQRFQQQVQQQGNVLNSAMTPALRQATTAFQGMGQAEQQAAQQGAALTQQLGRVSSATQASTGHAQAFSSAWRNIGQIVAGIGIATSLQAGVSAMRAFAQSAVEVGTRLESLRNSLSALAGSVPAGRPGEGRYTLRHLRRFGRELSHPQMVGVVVETLRHPALPSPPLLLCDATSLGGPVVLDLFRQAGVQPVPVVWHGGRATSYGEGEWRVAKALMVARLISVVETHRIVMHPTMPFAEAMLEEMRQYVREQSATTGREVFHAPATGAYDDLISATVMTCWWSEKAAADWIPPIDLSLGLRGTHKPSIHPRELRPRRFFRGDYPGLDWDEERS